jgi:hypothetical protein
MSCAGGVQAHFDRHVEGAVYSLHGVDWQDQSVLRRDLSRAREGEGKRSRRRGRTAALDVASPVNDAGFFLAICD